MSCNGASVIAFGSVLAVGLTLGLQNHEDHVLTAQITQTEADLRVLGGRIANIKDHEFKTTAEYVAAYAEIGDRTPANRVRSEVAGIQRALQHGPTTRSETRADQYSALAQPLQPRNLAEHIGTHRPYSPDQRRHETGSVCHSRHGFVPGTGTTPVLA